MKVKCKYDLPLGFKSGKFYEVKAVEKNKLLVTSDYGYTVLLGISNFHEWPENNDTPQIEVGSEWVATLAKQDEKTFVVLHVGQQMSLCKWVADDREFPIKNTGFNTSYKPKPKTVTMYFYKLPHGYVAYSNEHPFDTLAFTKEIEL